MAWGPGGKFTVSISIKATDELDKSSSTLVSEEMTGAGYTTLQAVNTLGAFIGKVIKGWGDDRLDPDGKRIIETLNRALNGLGSAPTPPAGK